MRRSDKEIKSVEEILEIIKKCDVCRLALCNENTPYLVPLNFGYKYSDGVLTLFFHGAASGKKIDMIKQNPVVCFEMDCSHRFVMDRSSCSATMEYKSVVGMGKAYFIDDKEEKTEALKLVMKQYVPEGQFEFEEKHLNAVTCFKVVADEFTGKGEKV